MRICWHTSRTISNQSIVFSFVCNGKGWRSKNGYVLLQHPILEVTQLVLGGRPPSRAQLPGPVTVGMSKQMQRGTGQDSDCRYRFGREEPLVHHNWMLRQRNPHLRKYCPRCKTLNEMRTIQYFPPCRPALLQYVKKTNQLGNVSEALLMQLDRKRNLLCSLDELSLPPTVDTLDSVLDIWPEQLWS